MADPTKNEFAVLQKQILSDLFKITKATAALQSESLLIQKVENPAFRKELDGFAGKELKLCNTLLAYLASPAQPVKPFVDAEDVQERWMQFVEVLDTGLEHADMALDRVYGRIPQTPSTRRSTDSLGSAGSAGTAAAPQAMLATVKHGNVSVQVVHATQIARCQELFKDDVDNSLSTPFAPKLKTKPHAQAPLPAYPATIDELRTFPVDHAFPHPYQYEIDHLTYPTFLFEPVTEVQLATPTSLEKSKMEWIDTVEKLEDMIHALVSEPYIAVDLEHHSYRSYQGFLCLMQITASTQQDYLVDTLALRMELHRMNTIFCDPKIVKIFHGADFDIIWLQRDLGCYVVNLFDTFYASKALQFPAYSLAYLLQHFCQLTADKKYQLADWRLRPIPQEMVLYARMDTHYLIYIFHQLRKLLSPEQLQWVLQRSKDLTLKVHTKSDYDFDTGVGRQGWAHLYARTNRPLDPLHFLVFKRLHQWRDVTARESDESTGYVLPNAMLLNIVNRLPTSASDVLACCHLIPPMVRTHANDLALLIKQIKETQSDIDDQRFVVQSAGGSAPKKRSRASRDTAHDEDAAELARTPAPEAKRAKARFNLTLRAESQFLGSATTSFRQCETPKNPVQQNSVTMILSSLDHFEALLPEM